MSSTLVYQQTSHSQTHSLSLKLNNPSKDAKCMWTAIESLSTFQKQETEIEYVHPSAKRPSMSERSLEMCTESLDSETGVFFTDSYLDFSTSNTDTGTGTDNNNIKKSKRQHFENNNNYSFPPPLTTMIGLNSLQVRPYREDGRLVIEAVLPPLSRGSCFTTERVDGRLRMSLVREREEVEEEEEDESEIVMEEGNFGNNNNNDINDNNNNNIVINNNNNVITNNNMEEKDEGLDNKGSRNEIKFHKVIGENKNGVIKVEFGGKMEKGENNELSQRSKLGNFRCKEGGRGNMMDMRRLNNWEPLWVTT